MTAVASTAANGGALYWLTDKLLAPALVAVIFAGTTTAIIERYRGKREAVTKLADGLRDELKLLLQHCIDYWSKDAAAGDAVLEAKIIAAQHEVSTNLSLLRTVLKVRLEIDALPDLFDAVTGGDFQTADRKADPDRIRRVARQITSLRTRIGEARLANLIIWPWKAVR